MSIRGRVEAKKRRHRLVALHLKAFGQNARRRHQHARPNWLMTSVSLEKTSWRLDGGGRLLLRVGLDEAMRTESELRERDVIDGINIRTETKKMRPRDED